MERYLKPDNSWTLLERAVYCKLTSGWMLEFFIDSETRVVKCDSELGVDISFVLSDRRYDIEGRPYEEGMLLDVVVSRHYNLEEVEKIIAEYLTGSQLDSMRQTYYISIPSLKSKKKSNKITKNSSCLLKRAKANSRKYVFLSL